MCLLLLRAPEAILFCKELPQASEMSPSQPAAGSPCHGMLSPAPGGKWGEGEGGGERKEGDGKSFHLAKQGEVNEPLANCLG